MHRGLAADGFEDAGVGFAQVQNVGVFKVDLDGFRGSVWVVAVGGGSMLDRAVGITPGPFITAGFQFGGGVFESFIGQQLLDQLVPRVEPGNRLWALGRRRPRRGGARAWRF